jgi:anti-sigma-K factor RskA/putative zinc finger protein
MGSHEEFLELCAAAVAGELSADEQARLDGHLAVCPGCRRAKSEYEAAAVRAREAFAEEYGEVNQESMDDSWSVEKAEAAFFKRLDKEQEGDASSRAGYDASDRAKLGKRFTYRRSQIRWREVWMPFAAAILLALALGVAAYKTGVKQGTDVARTLPHPAKESDNSLEAQASDAGHERAQMMAKLGENAKVIDDLKQQLSEQIKIVNSLKSTTAVARPTSGSGQENAQGPNNARRDEELATAQAKLAELQKTMEAAAAQRDENARQAATLETKVTELTELVKEREQALDQRNAQVAQGQELLEHDRDIRELMGARDLYMADIRDVSGKGTDKTQGRVFYTKGKRLIFYAFDLDAEPGVRNASSFQAWGRRGPDKQQALSLGILYEDNVSKKRWVLKASDPKTLEDIDAVFVTVEPNGGSQHPSGKQLLFAYLRVGPNHP